MITLPMMMSIALVGIFEVMKAARGAAITPPEIKPKTIDHGAMPIIAMNVIASANVTKNSEMFTDPITLRGVSLRDNSVEVTIGPHPPPPAASKNPPKSPKIV